MSYQVLARKWRPVSFDQVVGQQHVLQALVNALDQQRLHHAYLFTGTRGIGKTSIARLLAKALNCEQSVSSKPCGQCQSCVEIDKGNFIDLIEVDAASKTKVEDTRDILDNVQYKPTRGRYKVYLIDEVHMLSRSSFNALLKTLEEPPEHVKFLFATTEAQKLPITILSRCLQFNLKVITAPQIAGQLSHILDAENVSYDSSSVNLIADAATGSMRDALSLTDQAIAFGNGSLVESTVAQMLGTLDANHSIELISLAANGSGELLLKKSAELAEFAPDYDNLLKQMAKDVHLAAMSQITKSAARSANDPKSIVKLASAIEPEMLQLFYHILLQGRKELEFAPDPQSGFEMVLLRLLAFIPKTAGQSYDETVAAPKLDNDEVTELKVLSDQQDNILEQAASLTKERMLQSDTSEMDVAKTSTVDRNVGSNAVADETVVEDSAVIKDSTVVVQSGTASVVEKATTNKNPTANINPNIDNQRDSSIVVSEQSRSEEDKPGPSLDSQFSEQDMLNMSYAMSNDDSESSLSDFEQQPPIIAEEPVAGIDDFVNARNALRQQLNKAQDVPVKKPQAVKEIHPQKNDSLSNVATSLPQNNQASKTAIANNSKLVQQATEIRINEGPTASQSHQQNVDDVKLNQSVQTDAKQTQSIVDDECDPATILAPNTDDPWSVMIDSMGIGGRLRLLAVQSSYHIEQQNVSLLLRPEHQHLLAQNVQQQLQQHIEKYLQQDITLTIEVGSDQQLTPDQIATNLHQQRLNLAIECIATDSVVNQFERQFDAQLNRESINYRSLKKVS